MRSGRAALGLLLVALLAPAIAGERGGPKVGSTVRKFDVQDVTGPHKGKSLCYV